jgi:hypothetical protein
MAALSSPTCWVALEALGEQVHERGVDVVDASPQPVQLGRDGRFAHPVIV